MFLFQFTLSASAALPPSTAPVITDGSVVTFSSALYALYSVTLPNVLYALILNLYVKLAFSPFISKLVFALLVNVFMDFHFVPSYTSIMYPSAEVFLSH